MVISHDIRMHMTGEPLKTEKIRLKNAEPVLYGVTSINYLFLL